MTSLTYEGLEYEVKDPSQDLVVKRGILDFYELSKHNDEWLVIEPFIFWSSRIQQFIVAPRWFITDLASIPQLVRNLIPVNGFHRHAAVCHDVLYSLSSSGRCSKEEADKVFLDMMKLYGVSRWKQIAMYQAVNLFGRKSWEGGSVQYAPLSHRMFYARVHTESLALGKKLSEGAFM